MIKTLQSVSETQDFGEHIASHLKGGDVVALHGDLGSGKTTLAQGIARGLGVTQTLTSPTFTLMNVYSLTHDSANQLVHIDTYRLDDESDLIQIGAHEIIGAPHTISIIEWPEKMPSLLPAGTIHLRLNQKNSICSIEYPENRL